MAPHRDATSSHAPAHPPHPRAVVLLAGAIRSSDLSRGIGRAILDLPIDASTTILDRWCEQASRLAAGGRAPMPVRVLLDHDAVHPRTQRTWPGIGVSLEKDPNEIRGTAGLLKDISRAYEDDDVLVVANANQVLLEPMEGLVGEMARCGGDVCLLAHGDGTPVGLMLVRVRTLRAVRDTGFTDFKEQWLPNLAKTHEVKVVTRPTATGMPVRTLEAYLDALTRLHTRGDAPVREDWLSTFAIKEPNAQVPASARVHDSVVLAGAQVGERAVIVRSVIAGGARIPAGAVVEDEVVGEGGTGA